MNERAPLWIEHRRLGGSLRALAFLAFSICVLAGCPRVRLVSEYDPVIDQKTTDLAAMVAAFGTRMDRLSGSPEGTYERNVDFYDSMTGAIAALTMRAKQHEKNDATLEMLGQLSANIERLRKLHQLGGERVSKRSLPLPRLARSKTNARTSRS